MDDIFEFLKSRLRKNQLLCPSCPISHLFQLLSLPKIPLKFFPHLQKNKKKINTLEADDHHCWHVLFLTVTRKKKKKKYDDDGYYREPWTCCVSS